MGKTDEVTKEIGGNIFDDVFRTMAQKMPQLFVALINEVFNTSYSETEKLEQKPK